MEKDHPSLSTTIMAHAIDKTRWCNTLPHFACDHTIMALMPLVWRNASPVTLPCHRQDLTQYDAHWQKLAFVPWTKISLDCVASTGLTTTFCLKLASVPWWPVACDVLFTNQPFAHDFGGPQCSRNQPFAQIAVCAMMTGGPRCSYGQPSAQIGLRAMMTGGPQCSWDQPSAQIGLSCHDYRWSVMLPQPTFFPKLAFVPWWPVVRDAPATDLFPKLTFVPWLPVVSDALTTNLLTKIGLRAMMTYGLQCSCKLQ